jgi:hypothetical protein
MKLPPSKDSFSREHETRTESSQLKSEQCVMKSGGPTPGGARAWRGAVFVALTASPSQISIGKSVTNAAAGTSRVGSSDVLAAARAGLATCSQQSGRRSSGLRPASSLARSPAQQQAG